MEFETDIDNVAASAFSTTPKLFGKWSYDNIKFVDECLQKYIAVETVKSRVFVPHTAGRYQMKAFRKVACPIIERFIGALMFHGRNAGKKVKAIRIIRQALEIIHLQTNDNPLQVIVDAICYTSAREDSTRIGSGGNAKRVAVDVSSFRRVNQAIYYLTKHARDKAFKNAKNIAETLADELTQAGKNNPACSSIKKKDDIEKNAKANR
jgi:small subunit ribosomal protein S5e